MRRLVLYVFHEFNDRVQNFFDKCIFYDEYENCDKASIINEIKKTGITII